MRRMFTKNEIKQFVNDGIQNKEIKPLYKLVIDAKCEDGDGNIIHIYFTCLSSQEHITSSTEPNISCIISAKIIDSDQINYICINPEYGWEIDEYAAVSMDDYSIASIAVGDYLEFTEVESNPV